MQNIIDITAELSKTNLGRFEIFSTVIILFCAFAILTAIMINFVEAKTKRNVKKGKRSIVATGSMLIFFLFFYALIRFGVGKIEYNNLYVRIPLIIICLLIIIFGTYVNIGGRLLLGKNWANQIKIYSDQTLISNGPYKIVRHPLYASLIWMFYAGSIIYFNYAAFLANTFIFIPFMYYRAKQEENLLKEQFKNYKDYAMRTGMFFPKIIK